MKLGIYLAVITALNMGCWFALQGYILAYGGLGYVTDAFFASGTIPQLLASIVNSSLMHVLVPFFSNETFTTIQRNAYSLLLLIGGFFLGICALLYFTAEFWVPLLVIGFSDQGKLLTVKLVKIQVIGMEFTLLGAILFSACHGQKRFVQAECAPLTATGLAFLTLLFILPHYGVEGAAWVISARSFVMIVILLPVLGMPVRPNFDSVKVIWRRVKPLLLSSTYYKSDQVVDRLLSSLAGAGQLSVFYFAQQIYLAGAAVIGKAIAAPIIPTLALHSKNKDWKAFHGLYRKRLFMIILFSIAAWLAILTMAHLLSSLATHFGKIGAINSALFQVLLLLLGGVLIGGLAGLVLAESFFAKGDSRTPALVLATLFTLGIGFKAVGFDLGGIEGLAFGTSIYFFLYPFVLYILLEKSLKELIANNDKETITSL